jgi:hypothetical protein
MKSKVARLTEKESALWVIDIQQRFEPIIDHWDMMVVRCCRLINFFKLLQAPIQVVEQYPKGLGVTVTQIQSALGNYYSDVHPKTCFSGCGNQELTTAAQKAGRKQWVLCGIESQVCVQQTAFDLLDLGYEVFLAADAVSSRHVIDYQMSLDRMRAAGVIVTTSEALIFEVLRDSKHPLFKEASNIVKSTESLVLSRKDETS